MKMNVEYIKDYKYKELKQYVNIPPFWSQVSGV